MIEHHVSYTPEFKVRSHAYCHRYYHNMLSMHWTSKYEFLRAITRERIKNRFKNRLLTGRGDGYIPFDQRTHYLPPFGDILLRRHREKLIIHYYKTRYMADAMGIKEVPR